MDYRFSKNRPEIVKTLASKLSADSTLSVWQKQDDGSRSFLEKMSFHTLYPDEGVFTLKITIEQAQHIDPKKDVYFLLEEHDFIFKTKLAVDQKEYLTLQIPKEVRLKELRTNERKCFMFEDKKSVEVVFALKNNDQEISLSCPLLNISEKGASIIVSKETLSNINFAENILFKLNTDFQPAVIRNARIFIKKNLNKDELYAIGIQFK